MTEAYVRLIDMINDGTLPLSHAHVFAITGSKYNGLLIDPHELGKPTREGIFQLMWKDIVEAGLFTRDNISSNWRDWRTIMDTNMSVQTRWYLGGFLEVFKKQLVDDMRLVKSRKPKRRYFKKKNDDILMECTPDQSFYLLVNPRESPWMTLFKQFLLFVVQQPVTNETRGLMIKSIASNDIMILRKIEHELSAAFNYVSSKIGVVSKEMNPNVTKINAVVEMVNNIQQPDDIVDFNVPIGYEYSYGRLSHALATFSKNRNLVDEGEYSEDLENRAIEARARQLIKPDFNAIRNGLKDARVAILTIPQARPAISEIEKQLDIIEKYVRRYTTEQKSMVDIDAFASAYQIRHVNSVRERLLKNYPEQVTYATSWAQETYINDRDNFEPDDPWPKMKDRVDVAVARLKTNIKLERTNVIKAVVDMLNHISESITQDGEADKRIKLEEEYHKSIEFRNLSENVDKEVAWYMLEKIPNETEPKFAVQAEYIARVILKAYEIEQKARVLM